MEMHCIERYVNEGGVYVATTNRIICYEISGLDTVCEMIWAEIHFSGPNPLCFSGFY